MNSNLPKHWLIALDNLDDETLKVIERLFFDERLQMAKLIEENSALRKKISNIKSSFKAIIE